MMNKDEYYYALKVTWLLPIQSLSQYMLNCSCS